MTPAFLAYINEWLDKAENDLIAAQRLLEIEPMILDTACFHCQQAIEKFLKAFLIYHGWDIERTHNVIFLLEECSKLDPVFATVDPRNINVYAVQIRYPDSSIIPAIEEAKYFYDLALHIKDIVSVRIILS